MAAPPATDSTMLSPSLHHDVTLPHPTQPCTPPSPYNPALPCRVGSRRGRTPGGVGNIRGVEGPAYLFVCNCSRPDTGEGIGGARAFVCDQCVMCFCECPAHTHPQGDVRILLEQYKKLALHYEALHAAVNTRHAASRTAAEQATASTSVLPPLTTTAIPIPDPAAASQPTGDEDGSPSMLKLLNPFTRVPRAIKGTLSLLDGTTSLIPSTAAAAWSATAAAAAATTAAVGGGGEVRVRPKPM